MNIDPAAMKATTGLNFKLPINFSPNAEVAHVTNLPYRTTTNNP
jgi:hypothetical protein